MAAGLSLMLLVAVALPLLAPLALWWPRWRERVLQLAWLAALPALLLALFADDGLSLRLDWVFLGAELSLAGSSRIFLLFTAWLWLLAAWFAAAYLARDRRAHNFLIFFFLAMAGNFGLIIAQDLITFNVFFTLMGLSAYGLVVHNRDYAALRAGRIYLALVLSGEVLIFVGLVGWVWQTGGAVHLDALAGAGRLPWPLVGCLLLGFGIKAGMLPLHGWLPLAHPAAPVPASAVLSGAMIKAGLLGWLRFLPPGEQGVPALAGLLLLLGLAAAVYGVLRGLRQPDPKTILAWSSISQMGLLTVGLGIYLAGGTAQAPALVAIEFYAVHHGLAKGALFLAVAAGLKGVLGRLLPLLPALALAGAPLTSGFWAKKLLLAAGGQQDALPAWFQLAGLSGAQLLGWLLTASSLLTALLLFHFLSRLWQQTSAGVASGAGGSRLKSLLPLLLLIISGLPLCWRLPAPLATLSASLPTATAGDYLSAVAPLLLALPLAWLATRSGGRQREAEPVPATAGGVPGGPRDQLPLPSGPLTALTRHWQRWSGKRQNQQAALRYHRRRLLTAWQQPGERLEQLLALPPVAGALCLALLILFFRLID